MRRRKPGTGHYDCCVLKLKPGGWLPGWAYWVLDRTLLRYGCLGCWIHER